MQKIILLKVLFLSIFYNKSHGLIVSKSATSLPRIFHARFRSSLSTLENVKSSGDVILEISVKKQMQKTDILARTDYGGINSRYRANQIGGSSGVATTLAKIDTVLTKMVEIIFNPIALVMVIYFFAFGWVKVEAFINRILNIFGKGKKVISPSPQAVALAEQPFQVYECEKCNMQMRPAKGRAQKILSKKGFRCSRCGAGADCFFNIDDLEDPRAVNRIERLKLEENEDYEIDNDD